jgi:hypothetical protein
MTTDAARAKALFEAIRRKIARREVSHHELKTEVAKAFEKYFTELSQPVSVYNPLLKYGLRDPEEYSETLSLAQSDIEAGFEDAQNLSQSIVASFNASTTQMNQLDSKVKKVTSKSQDLQHLSDLLVEDTIVAGDDFADDSRIDRSMAVEAPLVDMPLNQNNITLKRNSSENVLELNTDQITVRVMSSYRIYEGFFYALEGQARPEGGQFHFSGPDNSIWTDSTSPGIPPDLLQRYNSWRTDPTLPTVIQTKEGKVNRSEVTADQALAWSRESGGRWGPFTQAEWDMIANNYHTDTVAFGGGGALSQPSPRQAEFDKGASIEERRDARKRMIDGNPDSFWECEFVIDSSEALPAWATSHKTVDLPAPPPIFKVTLPVPPNTPGSDSQAQGGDTGPTITLGELIARISGPAVDWMDLDCTIVLELPDPVMINFINLMPHNFSESTWLEVTEVATSLDGADFEPIEGMTAGKYENVLTDEANSELTEEEVSVTLAPNKFQYTGQGVWTFPVREAKYIKLKLVQKTPIPAPYEVMRVEMTQTVTTTTTEETPGLLGDIFGGLF